MKISYGVLKNIVPAVTLMGFSPTLFANLGISPVPTPSVELPLIPVEKDLQNFPKPITEEENDIVVLEKYYQAVADAYRQQGEEQEEKLKTTKIKLQKQEENLFLRQLRPSKSYVSWNQSGTEQGILKTIQYAQRASNTFQQEVKAASEKAAFYQDIAENYRLLAKEEAH